MEETPRDNVRRLPIARRDDAGPLRWMTASEAAEAHLVEEWTDDQVEALEKLGEAAITFGLGVPADGRQWVTDDSLAPLVLTGLGVEHDRIWTRSFANDTMAVDPSLSLPELAAAICLVRGSAEPRLPQVQQQQDPPAIALDVLSVQASYTHLLNMLAPRLWPDSYYNLDAEGIVLLKERARHLMDVARQPDPTLAAAAWRAAYAPIVGPQPPAPVSVDPGVNTGQYL